MVVGPLWITLTPLDADPHRPPTRAHHVGACYFHLLACPAPHCPSHSYASPSMSHLSWKPWWDKRARPNNLDCHPLMANSANSSDSILGSYRSSKRSYLLLTWCRFTSLSMAWLLWRQRCHSEYASDTSGAICGTRTTNNRQDNVANAHLGGWRWYAVLHSQRCSLPIPTCLSQSVTDRLGMKGTNSPHKDTLDPPSDNI